jgi:uncharacterized coiled-coil protein SlyX
MNSTDQRIEAVEAKLGSIVDSISQLNSSLGQVLGNMDLLRVQDSNSQAGATAVRHSQAYSSRMSHKDVIDDGEDSALEHHGSTQIIMPPEMQVQRLTAQLTAAYSRIAALEEQLLSRRIQ